MHNLRFQYTDGTSYCYTFDFVYKQCKDKEICIKEEKLANLKVYLDREDSSLVVYDKSIVTFRKFTDVIITELNDQAKARLGAALPLSDSNTADIAIDAIKNQNPAYCVYENEFNKVNISLDKVIDNIYNFNKESFQEDRYYYLQSSSYNIEECHNAK